ncbi:hypothetical protein LEMLEM_LOCUS18988 [Lemmus lemmus]
MWVSCSLLSTNRDWQRDFFFLHPVHTSHGPPVCTTRPRTLSYPLFLFCIQPTKRVEVSEGRESIMAEEGMAAGSIQGSERLPLHPLGDRRVNWKCVKDIVFQSLTHFLEVS